jgi:predicted ArsR family transcriptional regulator
MSSTIAAHLDPAAVRQAIAVLQALLPTPAPVAPPIGAPHLRDRVLRLMRTRDRYSAPELQHELASDSVAIANALRDLVARGLVVRTREAAPRVSGKGRAPRYYRVISRPAAGRGARTRSS